MASATGPEDQCLRRCRDRFRTASHQFAANDTVLQHWQREPDVFSNLILVAAGGPRMRHPRKERAV